MCCKSICNKECGPAKPKGPPLPEDWSHQAARPQACNEKLNECQPRKYLPGIELHAMPGQFVNNTEKLESHITGYLQITSVGRA